MGATETLDDVIGKLQGLRADLAPPTSSIRVTAGQAVQPIINAASPGTRLVFEPASYLGSLDVSAKPIFFDTLQSLPAGRVSPGQLGVNIIGSLGGDAITNNGDMFAMRGINVGSLDETKQLVSFMGTRFTMIQSSAIGGPRGQHRGLRLDGNDALVKQCYVDECWLPGRDAQAVMGWDGARNIRLDDSYFGGGAQSMMWGGGDSVSSDRIPTGIYVTYCDFSKNPVWYTKNAQIKCAVELKSVAGFTMLDSRMKYAGTSEGQAAYLLLMTIRNQDKRAPWSTIRDVLVDRCHGQFGSGGMNILGADDTVGLLSETMTNVTVRNTAFTDLDPLGITKMQGNGSGRGVMFSGGAHRFTMDGVTFDGKNMAAAVYINNNPLPTMFVARNIKSMPSAYGWKLDGVNTPGANGIPAIQQRMLDAVFAVTPTDTGAKGYPE